MASAGAPSRAGADDVADALQRYNAVLQEQQEAAAALQELLKGSKGQLGLIANTDRRVHSFTAAIANAKNPGYFTYYKAPAHIVEQEHASELETRTAAVAALQERLEAARGEVEAARERRRLRLLEEAKAEPSASSGLEAWFAEYGRPAEGAGGEGYRSTFKASPKMHGGSKHYPAFKSGATVMRVGRMMK